LLMAKACSQQQSQWRKGALSSKMLKVSNRLKIALRNVTNAIGNLKDSTPVRDFFQRINFRKGLVSDN
jgi:transposase